MPIFEYRCAKCKQEFEEIVFSDRAEIKCPKCGSRENERLLPSFAVKGGSQGGLPTGGAAPCGRPGGT